MNYESGFHWRLNVEPCVLLLRLQVIEWVWVISYGSMILICWVGSFPSLRLVDQISACTPTLCIRPSVCACGKVRQSDHSLILSHCPLRLDREILRHEWITLVSDNYLVNPDPVLALTFTPNPLHPQILCPVPSDASFNSPSNYLFQQSWKVLLPLVSFPAGCMELL